MPLHSLARFYKPSEAQDCDTSLIELLEVRKDAAGVRDAKGRTPLHVLARYHGSLVTPLRMLAWMCKDAVSAKTSDVGPKPTRTRARTRICACTLKRAMGFCFDCCFSILTSACQAY